MNKAKKTGERRVKGSGSTDPFLVPHRYRLVLYENLLVADEIHGQ